MPTAGRQYTMVGDAMGTRPPSGLSTMTAMAHTPASQCSLCASNVTSPALTETLEQRSTLAGR
jgi:hypothetical protein